MTPEMVSTFAPLLNTRDEESTRTEWTRLVPVLRNSNPPTVAPLASIKVLAALPRLESDAIPRKPPPSMTSPVKVLALVRLKPLVAEDVLTNWTVVAIPAGELITPPKVIREFWALFKMELMKLRRMLALVAAL